MTTSTRIAPFVLAFATLFAANCDLPAEDAEGEDPAIQETGEQGLSDIEDSTQPGLVAHRRCTQDSDCGPGSHCKGVDLGTNRSPRLGCPSASRPGFCQANKPWACNSTVTICGCDGRTYANECAASAAGVAISAWRACPRNPNTGELAPDTRWQQVKTTTAPAGAACSSNNSCGADQYCVFPEGQCGGMGTCASRNVCWARVGEQLPQVCGCDGRTYANRCAAQAAGVSLAKCPQ